MLRATVLLAVLLAATPAAAGPKLTVDVEVKVGVLTAVCFTLKGSPSSIRNEIRRMKWRGVTRKVSATEVVHFPAHRITEINVTGTGASKIFLFVGS